MPFYEYECPSCRYCAEVMQKITDAPLKKCPSCGKAGFKRLISAPVFRLKGSGWYETDFKSDKEGKRNLAGPDREDSKPADEGAKSATAAKSDKPAPEKSSQDKSAESKPTDSKSGDSKRSAAADGAGKSGSASRPRRAVAKTAARAPAARPRAVIGRKPGGAGRKHK
jgi:putative FmdB family regulatory protein